ncbi:golgin subfamily A member 2-like [Dipodomys merriami]|uniref:golgin subfamily A member 2-like n=1 Tax=Dipodomys merriami TaxID=94247 RepID=UPI003855A288
MKELVTELKLEKDNFAEDLRLESSMWKKKVQQLLEQMSQLREKRKQRIEENQSLSLQNLEQQEQLWMLEKAEEWDQHAEDRHNILEIMEREHETMRCTLVHNQELTDQLALLQDAFHRLSSEKEELASILHSEQQVKKYLWKLDQQEEKLEEWKEVVELNHQGA